MLAILLIVFAVFAIGWLVTLPIRLAFRLVFGVVFGILRLVLGLLFSPLILLVVGFFIVAAFVFGIIAHLLPLVLLGLIGYGVYRLVSRRSVSTI
jgi:hypothetical protein